MKPARISTKREPAKKGPRKLKSWPLLAAQKVYRVRLTTTPVVRITASKIAFSADQMTSQISFNQIPT